LDLEGGVGVVAEKVLGVLAALADALVAEGVPGAGFFDHAGLYAEIDQLAPLGDAFAVHDVEFDLPERWRHLVLHHLDPRGIAHDLIAILDLPDPADIEPHAGVELQRIAARRGFGRAEHHADLHADLVDEDHHAVRAADGGGQLAHRLGHQPSLGADLSVAHFAFELGFGRQGRDRIDHHHGHRAGTHQRFGDFE